MPLIDLCIDARMAHSSGIGTFIRHLVPFLNQPPFRVILLVQKTGEKWCEGIEQILFTAPIYSLKEQLNFPLIIPRCDLFWSPHYNVPISSIKAKKRVVTIHDVCHLVFGSFLQKNYAKLLLKRALQSDAIVTDSTFSKEEIGRFFPHARESVQVVAIGVDREKFKKSISEEVRKKYGLPSRYALYVGNLKRHKNMAGLAKAFHDCDTLDLGLVLAGKGDEKPTGPNIYPIGGIEDKDLAPLYSMAEVFIFPSFYEGFGLPPLEAMCCECPTIVSNAASMPEVCGDATEYINPKNPSEIAAAIKKISGDAARRKELIEKGLERVQHFSWQDTAIKYRQLFEEAFMRKL